MKLKSQWYSRIYKSTNEKLIPINKSTFTVHVLKLFFYHVDALARILISLLRINNYFKQMKASSVGTAEN